MLWKLFSSDERVMRALAQSRGYDISPITIPANNDEPKVRLWLEDWSEKDEARLKRLQEEDYYWDNLACNS